MSFVRARARVRVYVACDGRVKCRGGAGRGQMGRERDSGCTTERGACGVRAKCDAKQPSVECEHEHERDNLAARTSLGDGVRVCLQQDVVFKCPLCEFVMR
eukprot:5969532-Prymnesium_polylepis.1